MGRKPRAYTQAERLASLMRALASRSLTITDISREFCISRRQVYRDLGQIEEAGHPLIQNCFYGERTWQLPLGYRGLPPIAVTPYELMSLYLAKQELTHLRGTPFLEDLESLIQKVQAGLQCKTLNHVDRLIQVFTSRHSPIRFYDKKGPILRELQRSLLLQRSVILSHQKPEWKAPVLHQVDPYSLLLHQCGLYVLAYSHRAQALRLFAVERIQQARVTDEAFTIPADFSPTAYARHMFGLMDEPSMKIRIRFGREVAYLIKERQWHPTQTVKTQKNGAVILALEAGGLEELTSWILSFGQYAKVLGPPSLREAVRTQLVAAHRFYSA